MSLSSLADPLLRLMPQGLMAEAEAMSAYLQDVSTQTSSLRTLPPDSSENGEPIFPTDIDPSDPSHMQHIFGAFRDKIKPKFLPLEMLPCANVQATKYMVCPKHGTKACSGCKLVSYCSKECQKIHWLIHKHDCKNQLKSNNWKPAWIAENRFPTSFFRKPGESLQTQMGEFGIGLSLWGNMPAMDLINLAKNEKDASQDLSIALVASGDLRHVVKTINALPQDYSGHLQVLLNDLCLPVVARNIVILLILGTISDETTAADIALHFWYSVFMPAEYRLNISAIIALFLQRYMNVETPQPLGPRSSLYCMIPGEAKELFHHFVSSTSVSVADAQNEYDRVRTVPSRGDLRDRMYARLKLSHRLAFQEFRRFGIVLPFGAVNAHFNFPNPSLFSLDGMWLQTDHADPLDGWDIGPIFDAGRAHGTQPEDIYGCLYFFLLDQFRTFARRLRELHITFRVVNAEASNLSRILRENDSFLGIPPSVRFDRIDVSNILDANYVGLRDVLTHWGPLLKESRTSALVGYLMNWAMENSDGNALCYGRGEVSMLINAIIKKGRFPGIGLNGQVSNPRDMELGLFLAADDMNAIYDSSKAFSRFLRQQKLEDILRKTKLKLRTKRTVVPHRYKVPLHAAPNAVPDFADNEIWYQYTQIQSFTWLERFVEFARV